MAEIANQLQGDVVSRTTEEVRKRKIREHREKLARGEIDLGPFPDHSDTITDVRDMRDPESLGAKLKDMVERRGDVYCASEAADMLDKLGLHVPKYVDGFVDHARRRQDELRERAAAGDRFAAALLRGESLAEDPTD